MKGLIIINAYKDIEYQSQRLSEEFKKLGVEVDVLNNDFYACKIDNNNIIGQLQGYDFCIFNDKDKYISFMLERCGLRLFNRAQSIADCDDKMQTYIKLANHDIPLIKTLPGLLCHTRASELKEKSIEKIEKELGYPVIAKSSYGSFGNGVRKCDNREQLLETMEELKCKPHLFQQFIASSYGRDIRVIVIGGKFLCGYMRKSDDDFRSNIALGGNGYKIDIPQEVIDICEKVANILNLDYCGIDVLFDVDGYKICEVNSNAFFEGAEMTTGVNIAKSYAEYIINSIKIEK